MSKFKLRTMFINQTYNKFSKFKLNFRVKLTVQGSEVEYATWVRTLFLNIFYAPLSDLFWKTNRQRTNKLSEGCCSICRTFNSDFVTSPRTVNIFLCDFKMKTFEEKYLIYVKGFFSISYYSPPN